MKHLIMLRILAPVCNKRVTHMTKHMKTHIYNESMNEKCHICDKTFKLKKYLKQHLIHLIESHLLDIIEITGEPYGALYTVHCISVYRKLASAI